MACKTRVFAAYEKRHCKGASLKSKGRVVNDNNRLIVRAFAYAWRYKKLYESGMQTDDIAKQERISKRTIYKYLNLAYLSPRIVNQLLNGVLTINLQTLFDIASKNLGFEEQEKLLFK